MIEVLEKDYPEIHAEKKTKKQSIFDELYNFIRG